MNTSYPLKIMKQAWCFSFWLGHFNFIQKKKSLLQSVLLKQTSLKTYVKVSSKHVINGIYLLEMLFLYFNQLYYMCTLSSAYSLCSHQFKVKWIHGICQYCLELVAIMIFFQSLTVAGVANIFWIFQIRRAINSLRHEFISL